MKFHLNCIAFKHNTAKAISDYKAMSEEESLNKMFCNTLWDAEIPLGYSDYMSLTPIVAKATATQFRCVNSGWYKLGG